MNRQRLSTGTRLGRYEIRSLLGTGAMAEVYLASDPERGNDVALKVLAPGLGDSSERMRRFEREASAISRTVHPNIVSIFEVGFAERAPFIAMEYVRGRTLRSLLDEGRLAREQVLDIGVQLAEGLAGAHRAGIVHRDLKPENVMITPEGIVKILDFGLSKPLSGARVSESMETDEALTLPGTILGTLQYMSPEQASGYRVDYRADQFSLGAILYEMATGVVAFHRDTVPRTLAAIIEGQPAGLDRFEAEVPSGLRSVLEKLLQKSPGDRFAEMGAVAEALQRLRRRRPRGPLLGTILRIAISLVR